MWSVISGILKRELPRWLLASSETWNEAFLDLKKKTILCHNYKAETQQVKERTDRTAISGT